MFENRLPVLGPNILDPSSILAQHRHQISLAVHDRHHERKRYPATRPTALHLQGHEIVACYTARRPTAEMRFMIRASRLGRPPRYIQRAKRPAAIGISIQRESNSGNGGFGFQHALRIVDALPPTTPLKPTVARTSEVEIGSTRVPFCCGEL